MTAPPLLDIYDAAYLAGGPDRAVDTAVVALLQTGRIRVQGSGELAGELVLVDNTPRHPVEAAVLAVIGSPGWRDIDFIRWRAGRDPRLVALADRLSREGLLAAGARARLWGRLPQLNRSLSLTATGRRVLRQLRAARPADTVTAGTNAVQVALHGTDRMPDRRQRTAVFAQPKPTRSTAATGPRQRGLTRYRTNEAAAAEGLWGSGVGCGGCGGCGGGCGG
jgi:hypothetical protein